MPRFLKAPQLIDIQSQHFAPHHRSLTPLTTSVAVNERMFANVFVAGGHPLRQAEDSSDGSSRSGGQRRWL